jgi:hypothetical protein
MAGAAQMCRRPEQGTNVVVHKCAIFAQMLAFKQKIGYYGIIAEIQWE